MVIVSHVLGMSTPLDLGILISGRGSNLKAILDAIEKGTLNARVRLVLSNKAEAEGLAHAERAGIPTHVIKHQGLSREAFDEGQDAAAPTELVLPDLPEIEATVAAEGSSGEPAAPEVTGSFEPASSPSPSAEGV